MNFIGSDVCYIDSNSYGLGEWSVLTSQPHIKSDHASLEGVKTWRACPFDPSVKYVQRTGVVLLEKDDAFLFIKGNRPVKAWGPVQVTETRYFVNNRYEIATYRQVLSYNVLPESFQE
jgi:hypothetical protein